jgi:hypothetical protein
MVNVGQHRFAESNVRSRASLRRAFLIDHEPGDCGQRLNNRAAILQSKIT